MRLALDLFGFALNIALFGSAAAGVLFVALLPLFR